MVVDMNAVVNEIRNASSDELNYMIEEIKLRRNYIARNATRGLRNGTQVQFTGRGGQTFTGVVTKVNAKTVKVDTGQTGIWKVTASMLTEI